MRTVRVPLILALTLVAFAAAMAAGIIVHGSRAQFYAEQGQKRHQVTATVAAEAPRHHDLDSPLATVPARWTAAGAEHSGVVVTNRTAKTGDTIHIWVDDGGRAVNPAARTALDEAVLAALGIGLGVLGAALSVIGIAHFAIEAARRPAA